MKELKMLKLLFVALLLGVNTSFAQSQSIALTEEQKVEMAQNMEEYYQILKLSEEQKSEFEAITKKYAAQMITVRDGNDGKYKKYKKVKSIQKNKNSEMEKLLSKDQYKRFLEKQEEMQKKMRAKKG